MSSITQERITRRQLFGNTINLALRLVAVEFLLSACHAPRTAEPPVTPTPKPVDTDHTPAVIDTNKHSGKLRYDNAGCVTNEGLADGQTFTVAYMICHATSPTDAWVKIQAQIKQAEKAGNPINVITASPGTETTQALPLGTAFAVWNSTCPSKPLKVDVSIPSANLPGKGCIRFVPEYGAGDRTLSFEQAIAVW